MSEEVFTVEDRRETGFYQIDNELITLYAPKIKANGIAVYNALVYHASKKNADGERECWPSQNTLAKEAGMCRSAIVKALEKLEEHGLIKIISGRYDEVAKANEPNKYILLSLKNKGISSPCVLDTQPPCTLDTQGVVRQTNNPCVLDTQELDPINNTHINNTNTPKGGAKKRNTPKVKPPIEFNRDVLDLEKECRALIPNYPPPPREDIDKLFNKHGKQAVYTALRKMSAPGRIVKKATAPYLDGIIRNFTTDELEGRDEYGREIRRSALVGNGSRPFNKAQGGSGPGGRYTKAELDDDLGGSNHRKNRPIVAGTACS